MSKRVILTADDGMAYTDGTNYGFVIYLAEGADPSAYYQITEAEYDARMEGDPNEAGVADYQAALARLGVE
jgi:hypothetical protein